MTWFGSNESSLSCSPTHAYRVLTLPVPTNGEFWWRAGCIDVTAAAAEEEVVDAGDADDRGVTAEVVAAACC